MEVLLDEEDDGRGSSNATRPKLENIKRLVFPPTL